MYDIQWLAMGLYGLRQSNKYLEGSVDQMRVYTNSNNETSLKITNIQSRFSESISHTVGLDFDSSVDSDLNILSGLTWFCDCPSGCRTVSPCAHVIAVLRLIHSARSDDFQFQSEFHSRMRESLKDTSHHRKWAEIHESHCVCRKKLSETPESNWIKCDGCKRWYHPTCINMTDEEYKSEEKSSEEWFCPVCEETDDEESDIDGIVLDQSELDQSSNPMISTDSSSTVRQIGPRRKRRKRNSASAML